MSFSGQPGLSMSLNLALNVNVRSNDIGPMWTKPETTKPFVLTSLQ